MFESDGGWMDQNKSEGCSNSLITQDQHGLVDQSDRSQINRSMQIRWPINQDQSGLIADQSQKLEVLLI